MRFGGESAIVRGACFTCLAIAVGIASGCGASAAKTVSSNTANAVAVVVTSPTSGSVIAADNVTIRGTVTPANAIVQIQGKPAAVGNGVFTGTAALHGGTTTIDVIGSAPGAAPDATKLAITRQSAKGQSRTVTTQTVTVPQTQPVQPPADEAERAFFAPSGNVSCAIQGDGARCSVATANLTFVLPPGGGAAFTVQELQLSRASGYEAPFGSEESNGAVVCSIPPSDVPSGITCRDSATGHGFEASRVPSRRKTF